MKAYCVSVGVCGVSGSVEKGSCAGVWFVGSSIVPGDVLGSAILCCLLSVAKSVLVVLYGVSLFLTK